MHIHARDRAAFVAAAVRGLQAPGSSLDVKILPGSVDDGLGQTARTRTWKVAADAGSWENDVKKLVAAGKGVVLCTRYPADPATPAVIVGYLYARYGVPFLTLVADEDPRVAFEREICERMSGHPRCFVWRGRR